MNCKKNSFMPKKVLNLVVVITIWFTYQTRHFFVACRKMQERNHIQYKMSS